MKKLLLSLALTMAVFAIDAQTTRELEDMNRTNSWLKLGVNLGVPVGDFSNYQTFAMGLDVAGQFMRTDNFGLGVVTGFTKYFVNKDVPAAQDFSSIPLGLMLRYYPQSTGIFVGTDIGYSFFVNNTATNGGGYIRPQIGYHNYNWNLFAFYNQIFTKAPGYDVQTVGVAATYNIRFK